MAVFHFSYYVTTCDALVTQNKLQTYSSKPRCCVPVSDYFFGLRTALPAKSPTKQETCPLLPVKSWLLKSSLALKARLASRILSSWKSLLVSLHTVALGTSKVALGSPLALPIDTNFKPNWDSVPCRVSGLPATACMAVFFALRFNVN